jgi:TldD protein
VLFHEACGHGLEADLVAKEASVFAGRVGEQVASPLVTWSTTAPWPRVGRLRHRRRGPPASATSSSRTACSPTTCGTGLRARKEGRPSLGQRPPPELQAPPDGAHDQHLPAATATDDPDDIIASTEHGVYVAHLGGGQVNTATGDFVFGMTEAYLIENGEITEPLREGNLIGNGPEVLANIDAVGNDFAMGPRARAARTARACPSATGAHPAGHGLTIGGTAS